MMAGLKTGLIAMLCIVCFGSSLLFAEDKGFNLTGAWQDDKGGFYYIRQVGNQVFWNVDTQPSLMTVFHGTIRGTTIQGKWADLPKSKELGSGTLTLRIESNDRLKKMESSQPFHDASVWTRITEDEETESKVPTEEGLWLETVFTHKGCKEPQDFCQEYKLDITFTKGPAGLVEGEADQWTLKGRFTDLTYTFHIFEFNEYHGNGTLVFTSDFKSFLGEWETLDGHKGTWTGKR